jgi:hypothetical protein
LLNDLHRTLVGETCIDQVAWFRAIDLYRERSRCSIGKIVCEPCVHLIESVAQDGTGIAEKAISGGGVPILNEHDLVIEIAIRLQQPLPHGK